MTPALELGSKKARREPVPTETIDAIEDSTVPDSSGENLDRSKSFKTFFELASFHVLGDSDSGKSVVFVIPDGANIEIASATPQMMWGRFVSVINGQPVDQRLMQGSAQLRCQMAG